MRIAVFYEDRDMGNVLWLVMSANPLQNDYSAKGSLGRQFLQFLIYMTTLYSRFKSPVPKSRSFLNAVLFH